MGKIGSKWYVCAQWSKILGRVLGCLSLVFLVSACSLLPETGPNKGEIFAGVEEDKGNTFVVSIDETIARLSKLDIELGFPPALIAARPVASDIVQIGDALSLTVWENVDDGLFTTPDGSQTLLQEVQVDDAGFIFVPYAGRLNVAGKTPEATRRLITRQLQEQTPDPQVEVRRVAGDGSAVLLTGTVANQGLYPIEHSTRRLMGLIGSAGGLTVRPGVATVTVIRGVERGRIWFDDLQTATQANIALRAGDRIIIEEDTRSFTVLGAAGRQARVPFETENLNLLEALAKVGGLSGNSSDPTGIFVLRDEPKTIAQTVLQRDDLVESTYKVIYVANLTEPNGLFSARSFSIRDGDILYVTEAPFTQWSKVIGAFTGVLGSVSAVAPTVQGNL